MWSPCQYKTVYKKTVSTRNVTVALNLTDSLNASESALSLNLSKLLHTIQVGKAFVHTLRQSAEDLLMHTHSHY